MNTKNIQHLDLNRNGLYDHEVIQIHKIINYTPQIIFDLGANVGGFSVALSKQYPLSSIYAFEPVKMTYSILESNIKNHPNINAYNVGLSNTNKENIPIGMPSIPLNRQHNYGRATINNFEGEPIDYIKLIKFSDICKENNIYPDMLKIDVEGCEYDILENAKKSGILPKVKVIYIEINNHYNTKESAQKSKELLLQDFDIIGNSGYNADNGEPLNYIFKNKKS